MCTISNSKVMEIINKILKKSITGNINNFIKSPFNNYCAISNTDNCINGINNTNSSILLDEGDIKKILFIAIDDVFNAIQNAEHGFLYKGALDEGLLLNNSISDTVTLVKNIINISSLSHTLESINIHISGYNSYKIDIYEDTTNLYSSRKSIKNITDIEINKIILPIIEILHKLLAGNMDVINVISKLHTQPSIKDITKQTIRSNPIISTILSVIVVLFVFCSPVLLFLKHKQIN